jgi:hypothetical protein
MTHPLLRAQKPKPALSAKDGAPSRFPSGTKEKRKGWATRWATRPGALVRDANRWLARVFIKSLYAKRSDCTGPGRAGTKFELLSL